jgi:hypothetical protein
VLFEAPAVSVLTPNELARDLFKWVHDEEVVDALYLQVKGFLIICRWEQNFTGHLGRVLDICYSAVLCSS